MVKRFVILPCDRDWLTICAAMEAKGMPVELQGSEAVFYSWNRGWTTSDGVTTIEFAEPGEPIPPMSGWIRPDERDPCARKRQREAERDAILSETFSVREQRTVTQRSFDNPAQITENYAHSRYAGKAV
jgi:hypothetical protein